MPASLKATEKGPPAWAALVFFISGSVFSQSRRMTPWPSYIREGEAERSITPSTKAQTTTARVARPQVTTPPTREMTSWATPREVNPR